MLENRPIFFFAATLALIATAWCHGETTAEPLVTDAQLNAAGLMRYWDADIPLEKRDTLDQGFLVDKTLYVTTASGTIFAVKADVGLIRWGYKLTAPEFAIHRPSHFQFADGRTVSAVLTTDGLTLFDQANGDMLRRLDLDFPIGSPPVGVGTTFYAGSTNGRAYSMLITNACKRGVLERWEVLLGSPITAEPVLYGSGLLLLAAQGGDVVSCRAVDKAFEWHFHVSGAVVGDPAVSAGEVYVPSMDRSLYKLDGDTGTLLWRHRFSRELTTGPVVIGRIVYQWCQGHGLAALDATTGETKWQLAEGSAYLARIVDQDAVFSSDGQLLFVEANTGRLASRIPLPDMAGAVTNTETEAVFLLARDGRVLCARPADTPFLKYEQVRSERAKLHLPDRDEQARKNGAKASESDTPTASQEDPFRSRRDGNP